MIDKKSNTRVDGLQIVQREARLWRFHVEGRDVGPHMATKSEAIILADSYAREYGLIK